MSTVFRNRIAGVLWGFMAAWMAMLIVFTGLFLRDGVPRGHSLPLFIGILAVFWIGGLAATAHVLAKPLIEVRVTASGAVRVRRRHGWRVEERHYGPAARLQAMLVEGRDSDDDPYFHARLPLPDGDAVDLWEGHDRDRALAEVERFRVAVSGV